MTGYVPPYSPSLPDWMRLVSAESQKVRDKFRGMPATSEYASQSDIEADVPLWYYMPTDTDFAVSGSLAKNYFGPGSISLASGDTPGTQGGAIAGFSAIQTNAPGTGQHFNGVFKTFTGTRTDTGSAAGQNHSVALYGEAQRGAGSSDGVWGLNTITEVYNLDGATIGYEIDVNNVSGIDPGLSPAQAFLGLSVVSGNAGRGGTAITVLRNGSFGSNHWNRGIHVKDVLQRGIEYTNCGAATGVWADTTFQIIGIATATTAKIIPFGSTDILLRAVNPADSVVLLDVDQNTTASETNLKLAVAGTSAVRVSVGAADSGGTGFRMMRVPN